jgi:ubiquinone/menaquinone biosynthesis C-methylase UbiE
LYYKGEKMEGGPARDTDFHGHGEAIRGRLSQLISQDADVRVLDIGTGMGSTSRFLLEHLSKKSRIWSLDPSEDVIAQAESTLTAEKKENRRRIRFVQGTADDLKFDDDFFGLVVSVMVMHHIEDMNESIAEMSRVLKQGGRLIVIDYSPEAHTLDFQSRHAEEDFFTSASIAEAARQSRLRPRVEDHGKWYLVDATKAR